MKQDALVKILVIIAKQLITHLTTSSANTTSSTLLNIEKKILELESELNILKSMNIDKILFKHDQILNILDNHAKSTTEMLQSVNKDINTVQNKQSHLKEKDNKNNQEIEEIKSSVFISLLFYT